MDTTKGVRLDALPVAVIGAGPVGLAAAAHLLEQGETPLVLEAGDTVGASVLAWGHVRLFSPWRYNVDRACRRLLAAAGWVEPAPDDLPTGRELVERYLRPLARTPQLEPRIRLGARVVSVARDGFDKLKTAGRGTAPFRLHLALADGAEAAVLARAVVDASGTWTAPNPLGAAGVPALGERAQADRVVYGIPDALGAARSRYAGRRVLVVGAGHSAFNAILDLATLAAEAAGTSITWAIRNTDTRQLYGGGDGDALPARGALGTRLRRLVDGGAVHLVTGFRTSALAVGPDGGVLVRDGDTVLGPFDEVVAATGFRPDMSLLSELRLKLDPAVESTPALAPLIDPNVHSCGSVRPHGAAELAHPDEPGFAIAGMKSYGRAPTFLMLTGYEQVRSIACALAGDEAGARDVQLELPETGVCAAALVYGDDESAADCCGANAKTSTAPSSAVTAGGCCGAPAESACCSAAAPIPVVLPARSPTRELVGAGVVPVSADGAPCCEPGCCGR